MREDIKSKNQKKKKKKNPNICYRLDSGIPLPSIDFGNKELN